MTSVLWPVGIICLLAAAGIVVLSKLSEISREQQQRQRRELACRESEVARKREIQQNNARDLKSINSKSIELFKGLPSQVAEAEGSLDRAEFEFRDGAFAPFWEAIEQCAISLGALSDDAHQIAENAQRYADTAEQYEGVAPAFAVSAAAAAKLAVADQTSRRMDAIVREAQRNYHFASIYEQRKTNQILIAGFRSLGQAVAHMTTHLGNEIASLQMSIDGVSTTVRSGLRDLDASSQRRDREIVAIEERHAAAEREALSKLDDIRRDRRPLI